MKLKLKLPTRITSETRSKQIALRKKFIAKTWKNLVWNNQNSLQLTQGKSVQSNQKAKQSTSKFNIQENMQANHTRKFLSK